MGVSKTEVSETENSAALHYPLVTGDRVAPGRRHGAAPNRGRSCYRLRCVALVRRAVYTVITLVARGPVMAAPEVGDS